MENQENRPASQIDAATTQDEAIEAYLDRLCGPLKRVSPTRRAEIRREVQAHLQNAYRAARQCARTRCKRRYPSLANRRK